MTLDRLTDYRSWVSLLVLIDLRKNAKLSLYVYVYVEHTRARKTGLRLLLEEQVVYCLNETLHM